MKKILFVLSTVAACVSVNVGALQYQAPENTGPYVSANGGVNFIDLDNSWKNGLYTPDFDIKIKAKTGYYVGAAVGYKFCSPRWSAFRPEFEFAYRHNTLDFIVENAYERVKLPFDFDTYSYMANLYYDFDLNCALKPYWGFGLGYTQTSLSINIDEDHSVHHSPKKGDFSFQWIAGASYPVYKNCELGAEYRYFSAWKDLDNHSVSLNLKYTF